jgi:hypothetical protein
MRSAYDPCPRSPRQRLSGIIRPLRRSASESRSVSPNRELSGEEPHA